MILKTYARFFLAAKSPAARAKTLNFIKKRLAGRDFKEAGQEGEFVLDFDAQSWQEAVFALLNFAQSFGRRWVISGDINAEFDAFSSEIKIVGVEAASITCDSAAN